MDYLLECLISKSKQDLDIDIVKYGYKLLVSSIVGTLMVLLVAFFIFKIEDATIFLISFSVLRRYSGGYHCKTYVQCNSLLLLAYFGSVVWMKIEMHTIEYMLVIITLLHIIRIAPIKNKNRILDGEQIKRIKNKMRIIAAFYFLVLIYCWIFSLKSVIGYSIVLTSLLMIGGERYG